jgi:hypothetical protein
MQPVPRYYCVALSVEITGMWKHGETRPWANQADQAVVSRWEIQPTRQ